MRPVVEPAGPPGFAQVRLTSGSPSGCTVRTPTQDKTARPMRIVTRRTGSPSVLFSPLEGCESWSSADPTHGERPGSS
jgi:hypothetical protein